MRHHYLVATYNHSRYFSEMLSSIQAQYLCLADFLTHASVLVVDDCSQDTTAQALALACKKFPNVLAYVNPVNQGIGKNRNFLLDWACSRGLSSDDVVAFVDGDDILPETHLRNKLSMLEQEPSLECVGGQLAVFYEDGTPPCVIDTFSVDPQIQDIANIFECHFYVSNALFRGHVFKDPKVRFPETPTSEDWLFFATFPLVKRHCPNVTLRYRRHAQNLTTQPLDASVVWSLRRTARTLGLLKIGIHPSDRECELLNLVSYLTFRMRWQGAKATPALTCHLPWFHYLGAAEWGPEGWGASMQELRVFFNRVLDNNARVPYYQHTKLTAFLFQLLEFADAELNARLPA